jgi:hypothetical protein
MAAACLVAAVYLPTEKAPFTPVAAIRHVAEGDRLFTADLVEGQGDRGPSDPVREAIREYERAIAARPDYPPAHRALARIHLLSGTEPFEYGAGSQAFANRFGNPAGLGHAIPSYEQAVRLDPTDAVTLGDLGFAYIRAGRYEDAQRITNQAIELDRTQPVLWFNLAEISAALEDRRGFERAMETGLELFKKAPSVDWDPAAVVDLLGGVRSGLDEVARKSRGKVGDLARSLQGLVVVRERELFRLPSAARAPSGSRALRIGIRFDTPAREASPLRAASAEYDYIDVPAGTPLTHLWYFRRDARTPWNEIDDFGLISSTGRYVESEGAPSGRRSVLGPLQPEGCWRPGHYRLDVYAGVRLIGTQPAQPPAELLCKRSP